jgi:hypothetical protein
VNATANDITIEIADASGTVVGAMSGAPGDGASVAPYEVEVANADPNTLELTWSGGPCDARDLLTIDVSGRQFVLVQPECRGDAVAFDRVLIVTFAGPVDASEISAILQDGLDTPAT